VTRLVDDLLDVGRLTTGKINLRNELLRLSAVVARSVETARPVIAERHHVLEVEQPNAPVYVHADATRLSQVLQNLLLNAAKYTPDGGKLRLKVSEQDGFVNIALSDNGRGIAPENIDRIFQLFMQAEAGLAAPVESGLGIGLTLARSLMEMHGGTIDAQSAGLGKGSTFTVRMAVAQEAPAEVAPEQHEGSSGGLRVLVIDDNRDSADSATDVLRLLGNQVETAYDGASSVEVVRRFRPQMILLDLAMPGIDGFETRRRLKGDGAAEDAFFVAMTGFGNEDDKRRTRTAGFDAHLTKPVELDALLGLLGEAKARIANKPTL
jgi:CheY-like chemotaxis protein/two-component sensor histidine kinase